MLRQNGLRQKLVLLSVGVLALYYILVSVFTLVLMEPYYLHKVEQSLVDAYTTIQEMGEYDPEVIAQLEESNLNFVIADRETLEIVYEGHRPPGRPNEMEHVLPFILSHASNTETGYNLNVDELFRLSSTGKPLSGERRLMLGGVTDLYVVDISTSYASISQATAISLKFSLVLGLIVMLLAIVAFSRISGMVIRPVTQITNIANQIAHLDFSQKCEVQGGGEIETMAASINTMSDFMQSYTSQLENANAQLKEDIRLRQEQEDARKNLVANLSHDLKTPIGLISGYADGLRQGMARTEDEVREYCDVICDESDRMMSMIVKMMELFRLESGTVELSPEVFDLADLLNYTVEIFALEMERAGIRFSQDYGDCLYVSADYFAVEQVVTNYMQNAVTHIGAGKEIRLSVSEVDDSYRVSVFNSAEPISEDEVGKIWDSFYRLDKSRTRSRRESGLGLSIVRSNMELLGGDCGMRNVPGGVEFWAEFRKSPERPEPEEDI